MAEVPVILERAKVQAIEFRFNSRPQWLDRREWRLLAQRISGRQDAPYVVGIEIATQESVSVLFPNGMKNPRPLTEITKGDPLRGPGRWVSEAIRKSVRNFSHHGERQMNSIIEHCTSGSGPDHFAESGVTPIAWADAYRMG